MVVFGLTFGIGGLVIILITVVALVGKGGLGTSTPTATVGQTVTDGKFGFKVDSVSCGRSKIGGEYLNTYAQGQFCLVKVYVVNIGNRSQMFSSGNVTAYNAKGQEYEADAGAAMYLGEDSRSFLEDINPGNGVLGTVVFDIPKGERIAKLKLQDSMFSRGVYVKV
jgi:hypothetical protein